MSAKRGTKKVESSISAFYTRCRWYQGFALKKSEIIRQLNVNRPTLTTAGCELKFFDWPQLHSNILWPNINASMAWWHGLGNKKCGNAHLDTFKYVEVTFLPTLLYIHNLLLYIFPSSLTSWVSWKYWEGVKRGKGLIN